jgi:hypothetical protein
MTPGMAPAEGVTVRWPSTYSDGAGQRHHLGRCLDVKRPVSYYQIVNTVNGIVHPSRSGRRVVRRARPTLDAAYDAALAELPPGMHPAMIAWLDARQTEYETRLALSTVMTTNSVRWHTVDRVARAVGLRDHAPARASQPR